jgi:hypothetical protein
MPWRLEFGSSSFFIFIFNQTQSRQNQEKITPKTNTSLRHNRANFRIENQKRKESENQELDENSKSTLECLSSFCFLLGPTRDRDAGCRVPRVMRYAL